MRGGRYVCYIKQLSEPSVDVVLIRLDDVLWVSDNSSIIRLNSDMFNPYSYGDATGLRFYTEQAGSFDLNFMINRKSNNSKYLRLELTKLVLKKFINYIKGPDLHTHLRINDALLDFDVIDIEMIKNNVIFKYRLTPEAKQLKVDSELIRQNMWEFFRFNYKLFCDKINTKLSYKLRYVCKEV